MPFHGDYRMLKKQADIGISCGIPKENTFILENGEVLSLYKGNIKNTTITNQLSNLEKRISRLESIVSNNPSYNDSNFYMV